MMKKILFFVLLLLAQYSFAQIPAPQKNIYVNDFAQVLSKNQALTLGKQLHALEKASKVQVAIVLVKTVPHKYTIDKFAVLIGRKWHVGTAGKGIVYVAAINQHKQHIELDSAVLQKLSVIEREGLLDGIKPYFRQKDYNGGLSNLVQRLNQYFVPPPAPVAEPVAQKTTTTQSTDIGPVGVLLILLGFIALAIFAIVAFVRMCIKHKGDGWGGYPAGTSFFDRRYYRRNRWREDNYYNNTTNNYYDNNDDDDRRRNNSGSSSSSSSSSGGSFSNGGGSTSDW
ncbi:TPM domain-containing protein [Mucilaginibacter celer]|uniref:TPM domain-containing protein n=1 Tax=Mucilaginibacter celer TaxID=2305508 RepID=A0A494VPR5_9SPHI|nr:TPM domain-containing protein [Mucilaginibacter celer]AYL96774.1 TPM domain-containing protein [Mucilaginibacter celer]